MIVGTRFASATEHSVRRGISRSYLSSCLLFVALAFLCAPVQARFRQPNEEYQARRAKLRAIVDAPIIIFGYTGHEDASEVAVFFQETHFYYLTGHDQPGAVLLLIPDRSSDTGAHAGKSNADTVDGPREILYLPARDPSQEIWDGPKIGPNDPGIAEKTGFQAVEPLDNLKSDLAKLATKYKTFYTLMPPEHEEGYPHLTESVATIRAAIPHATLKDIAPQLDAMRQVKSPGELALMQKAIDLSDRRAFRRHEDTCARGFSNTKSPRA